MLIKLTSNKKKCNIFVNVLKHFYKRARENENFQVAELWGVEFSNNAYKY